MHAYQGIHLRHGYLTGTFLLALVALLWVADTGAQPGTGNTRPVSTVSVIEIPMQLSLDPLIKAAERTLPQQAGNWQSWKDWHGVESQYRAWRGPLSITASGDVLLVQAHIRYWIRARKKVLGTINLKAGCGTNEPPRQALIGMQVRLGWGPDWSVRPEFRILPTRFLDRCEMTIANIDVTPLVEKEFRKQMQKSLRAALQRLAPGMRAIQKQARRSWLLLQQPVDLGQDHWLMFRPVGVALSGIAGHGNSIGTNLAVALQPAVVTGARPAEQLAPLPPLEHYYPGSSGLNLQLSIGLDFESLNRELANSISGKSFALYDQGIGITKFLIAGSGQDISAQVELGGDAAGTVRLRARLVYKAEEQKLALQGLVFDYDTEDATMALLEETFHEYIRQALEDSANDALTWHLGLLGKRVEAALDKTAPSSVMLDLSSLQLRSLSVAIDEQGIRLSGAATGYARLKMR